MPRRYKQGADGQPHPAFYGKLPEEFSKADTMRFMVETDLKLSGCVSADTLAALRAEGYDYKDGNLVPAGKEETMQEKVANTTPAAPLKLDVSVRVIEPVKNLMGFASVKFNDCFVVENLKIVQGSKGLFLGMPSQPDGKGGYRDMAYPVTKEFREQLNTAVLQAYEAKLEDGGARLCGACVHQRPAQSRESGCRAGKGRTAPEGKAQPQRRALTSGHAGPKQKGGGNHATQTDGL